jgi:RimJ/RimL family protein N-acetyltransferase
MSIDAKEVQFLVGKKVKLRPLFEADLQLCLKWINDPEVRVFLSSHLPVGLEKELEWLKRLNTDGGVTLAIVTIADNKHIGNIGLHRIDWKDRKAETGTVIGEKDYWGKGYGTDAKMILLDYAFNNLNLHKITSRVLAFNKRSLHYSLHCGYKVEGTLRQSVFRNGKYWDEILLGVFKEEWLPYWKKFKAKK